MRKHIKCTICNEFHWTDEKCEPLYNVAFDDESYEVHSFDHREAAKKFAEMYNERHEHGLIGDSIVIEVERGGIVKKFKVGAEPDIHYFANEIETT